MQRKGWWVGAAALALLLPLQANATIFNFTVPLNGANEFPGPGDPDGFGTANLTIDDSTAPFPTISWNITVGNIDAVVADHIHLGATGVAGPIRVDFLGQLTGGPIQDADLVGVLADPSGWYVNVHTGTFPAGAIRGQVPEPTTALLLVGGLVLLARRRA